MLDPFPQDIRAYLQQRFPGIAEEQPHQDYYVFRLNSLSGILRKLKIHRNLLIFHGSVKDYLEQHDLEEQLKRGDVTIDTPLGYR